MSNLMQFNLALFFFFFFPVFWVGLGQDLDQGQIAKQAQLVGPLEFLPCEGTCEERRKKDFLPSGLVHRENKTQTEGRRPCGLGQKREGRG